MLRASEGSPSQGEHCFTVLKDTVLKGSFGYNQKRYLSVIVRIRLSCGGDLSVHSVCRLVCLFNTGNSAESHAKRRCLPQSNQGPSNSHWLNSPQASSCGSQPVWDGADGNGQEA